AAYRFTERFMGGHTDRTVAHSRKIQHMLCDSMGIPPARVIVIPNGVTPERFHPASAGERSAARTLHQLGSDDFVAVMAARIAPQKNHDLVIAALSELQRVGALPVNFRLLLAGRVSSAAYDRQVRAAIRRAGLDASGQVRFLGPVRDMQGLYAAADVVLLPSRSEASPIAALEALSAGVPLL